MTTRGEERRSRDRKSNTAVHDVQPLPNFCRYLCERFGEGWIISARGPCTPEAFRRAKRDYEAMIGARIYSPRYGRQFHPEVWA